jgi:tRNA (mo5U34)-methyltransferase
METMIEQFHHLKMDQYARGFIELIKERRKFLDQAGGNFQKFKQVLDELPYFIPSHIDLGKKAVTIGAASDLRPEESRFLKKGLEQLCPWRKGPFDLFGIPVDSEWQSWMKWDRIQDKITRLKGRRILDIGSSNGYYMFRMAAQDPLMVLGVEPQSTFYFQYLIIQKFLRQTNVFCLPVPHDALPKTPGFFDTVFCMGVLYHRNSPIQMLRDIGESMVPGGELILENLVIDSRQNICLFPKDRYAKMRNVFFIPDLAAMESWLVRAGFADIRCVDVVKTTQEEQRNTQWIQTETLEDFLDPDDPDKTVEGYPAPVRAIFVARAS